jgi:3-deoxy-D-manno-octulosonate 8-phosphate phosphatase (KDO 8-P phosphatase)
MNLYFNQKFFHKLILRILNILEKNYLCMKLTQSDFRKKCSLIKLVITDVDGVLTDGGMYYSDKGDIMKKFHARDGMGVTLLKKQKIPTIIITKEKTKIVREWSKKMSIHHLYDGVQNKFSLLEKISNDFNLQPKNIAFIGDDVNDFELLKHVGLAVTPNDGILKNKKISDYVCKNMGGNGAFREIADLILSSRKLK